VGPYVAECALLLVLSALRRVAKWNYRLKVEGKWRDREVDNRSLYGKRVGIHGYGSVPRALTKLLQPFDPVISTWDPWVTDDVLSANNVQRASSLEALYAESDILVNLLPLTARVL
jgi:phosphoglycerate dehydrogenase-like enzyme